MGYALLSLCLFKMLSFQILFLPSLFVFYIGIGFPIGAFLAARLLTGYKTGLHWSIMALPAVGLGVLLIGPFSARAVDVVPTSLPLIHHTGLQILTVLITTPAICLPFFIIWGAAEFICFQVALETPGLKNIFYVITIAALLTAFIIGNACVPLTGLLRTAALTPLIALTAFYLLKSTHGILKPLCLVGLCLTVWVAVGTFEISYSTQLFPKMTRDILKGTHHPITLQPLQQSAKTSLIKSIWGKYCHIALIQWTHPKYYPNGKIICCYDGVPIWGASPDSLQGRPDHNTGHTDDSPHPFGQLAFDGLTPGADICVIGAGGGAQAAEAIEAGARTVVAVDIVPEIFELLQGELSWINNGIYRHPHVQTVAMDGLSYMASCDRRFDRIILAATESSGRLLVSLFEPGQRLHSLESFKIMAQHLKPGGQLVICKTVDLKQRLFKSYSATLQAAGLSVSGFTKPSQGLESFMLFAASQNIPRLSASTHTYLRQTDSLFINFTEAQPPRKLIITENSPWISGLLGNLVPPFAVTLYLPFILAVSGLMIGAVLFWAIYGNWRRRHQKEPIPSPAISSEINKTTYGLAGILVGVNAFYLESGIIFWLIVNLMNPLASFFVGSILFLLLWGLSNQQTAHWRLLTMIGIIGIVSLLLTGRWNSHIFFIAILLATFGSGFCFSRLALLAPSRLLPLFVWDAGGTILGGLLACGLPFFYGFDAFFNLLPWLSLATLVLTVLAGAAGLKCKTAE